MERTSCPFEVKFAAEAEMAFRGYGSVFNVLDAYGDTITPGAFAESLAGWRAKGKLPKMLLQHGGGLLGGSAMDMTPIGKWDSMAEDGRGLVVEGRLFADDPRSKSIYPAMKAGELDGLSIGFKAVEWRMRAKAEEPRRTLTKIQLYEISPVTFGANESALIDAVKSIEGVETLSDAEDVLREAGFSRRQATAFVARLKAVANRQRDADEKRAAVIAAMGRARSVLTPAA